jgi:hypothetical protein
MASSAVGGSNLTLTFPNTSVIGYGLSGTDLYRYYSGGSQTIAREISSANFTVQDRVIYMTIAATPDSRWNVSENRTYQVAMRPTE